MEELEKEFPTAGGGKVPKYIPVIFAQYQGTKFTLKQIEVQLTDNVLSV